MHARRHVFACGERICRSIAASKSSRETEAALRRVATIESVGSSTRIEGVKLSDREVEDLLSRVDRQSFRTRDEQEVAGYAERRPGIRLGSDGTGSAAF